MRVQKLVDHSIFGLGILLALLIRWHLKDFESGDFIRYLEPWYNFIAEHGGLQALQYSFSNYSPPYLYWLVLASSVFSGLPKVVAVKLLAAGFDFVCAFFVYKIVQLKYPTGKHAITAFFVTLLLPTVYLNSSYWGQCDSIYTAGVIACLYFLCLSQARLALLSFGLAVSFKQQALFLAPLLFILLFKKKVHWTAFLLIPLTYFVAILPAWWVGRPLPELLLIYFNQTAEYGELTKAAPNLYQWFSNDWYGVLLPIGLLTTLLLVLGLGWSVYRSSVALSPAHLIQLALTLAVLIPYCLPKMHERYFFMADILSVPFALYFPRYLWVLPVVQLSSLLSYAPVLAAGEIVPLKGVAIALGATLIALLHLHWQTFHPPTDRPLSEPAKL